MKFETVARFQDGGLGLRVMKRIGTGPLEDGSRVRLEPEEYHEAYRIVRVIP